MFPIESIKLYPSFIIALFLWSCKGPKTAENTPIIIKHNTKRVLVLNEGVYPRNDADISIIYIDSNKTENNVFSRANSTTMGDVLQSAQIYDNKYFFVMNNSQKIIITDTNFREIGSINGLHSPRYIHFVNSQKAYVSDIYDNNITVINPSLKTIIKKIPCKGWTEHLIKDPYSENLWVSNRYTDKLYKIDVEKDILIDSITVVYGPSDMVVDKLNHLWVSCSGDQDKKISSSLLQIDLSTKTISNTFTTTINIWNSSLCTNAMRDTLYWADEAIKQMSINSNSYPDKNFIKIQNGIIYGFNLDPNNSDIYICDALDYNQSGKVYRYDKYGTKKSAYNVGFIPNSVMIMK